jgi:hypothetical protein
MNCPKCNTPDWFTGIFGGNCMNPGCSDWKNGRTTSVSVAISSPLQDIAPDSKATFKVGDRVYVHRGPGWDGKPDKYWMCGTIITPPSPSGYYCVKLDSGYVFPDGSPMSYDGKSWTAHMKDMRK